MSWKQLPMADKPFALSEQYRRTTEADLVLSDNTTADVSTSAHGLVPKATDDTEKFLRDDATWAYAPRIIPVMATSFNPSDSTTYYFGGVPSAPTAGATTGAIYFYMGGTITLANIRWEGGTSSNENITLSVRLNKTTDYAISTVGDTQGTKRFVNQSMAVPIASGDYITVKIVCPAWVTNPTSVALGGYLLLT